MRRVLVCGWVGSTNLGDELVLAGTRHALVSAFGPTVRIVAVSTAAASTSAAQRIGAVDHRRFDLVLRTIRQADLVVLGGGGLIQDETSPFNLPYHLSRTWLAALARTPWVGFGLGVGRLDTALGRRLASTLRTARAVSVRDEGSRELLATLGVPATLGTDAAMHLAQRTPQAPFGRVDADDARDADEVPRPWVEGDADPVIIVSLRPWAGPGGRLPVAWRRHGQEASSFVPTVASALERASRASGLPVRFVALQTDRDAALHAAVAARMATPTELIVPTLPTVLNEIGRGQLVVAMRYHAGVAATLAGRPSVLVGYSPKVDALAASLGVGATYRPFDPDALAHLDEAITTQLGADGATAAVASARQKLVARTSANLTVLRAGVP